MTLSGPGPLFAHGDDPNEARCTLNDAGLGDGLPVVIPTEARLAAMLGNVAPNAAGSRAADSAVHGHLPPLMGEVRADSVAWNAVAAGCQPGVVPLLLAILEACLEPSFNLLGLLTTTGTPAVAAVVRGPVAVALDMNSGTNCLGPGNAANATLGRAVSLCLRNIGGAQAGVGDMATHGSPGKYSFCFAEQSDGILAGPGKCEEGSFVTVLGVSGTLEVLPHGERLDAAAVIAPVADAVVGALACAFGGRPRGVLRPALLVPPEIAAVLVRAGVDREELAAAVRRRVERIAPAHAESAAALHSIECGGAGVKMTLLVPWAGGCSPVERQVNWPMA